MDRIATDLALVRQRIAAACQRSGRDPSSVTLVGVTKGVPPEAIRQALALGLSDMGENRVQEARQKQQTLDLREFRIADFGLRIEERQQSAIHNSQSAIGSVRWHMIGHLQRNKAKDAVELFDVIHSVDSIGLAEALERQAMMRVRGSGLGVRGSSPQPPAPNPERWLDVFVQVNVSGESTKCGCPPEDATALARTIMDQPHLRLRGLMTLAPFSDDAEQARPYFRRLRLLRDELQKQLPDSSLATHHSPLLLSMGMSGDFEVAIEEGADVVRIGTALFGT